MRNTINHAGLLALVVTGLALLLAPNSRAAEGGITLKEAYAGKFVVGAAVNKEQILGTQAGAHALIKQQFNALTAENDMKWERIQPVEGEFDWSVADALVEFAEQHDLHLTGHTLLWHQQVPDWVFEGEDGEPASREQLLQRLEDHIKAVAARYRGKVDAWDVVNEALNEDGSLRQTPWLEIIGESYLASAFEFAREADPGARLMYNDYNLYAPAKRQGAVRLIRSLQDQGVTVDGIGLQGHYGIGSPELVELEDSILAFKSTGVPSSITELDVSVLPFPENADWGADISVDLELNARFNPYVDGLPALVAQQQSDWYVELFKLLLKHADTVERVTFWGLHDGDSWKNNWPMQGRTDYPLLIDRTLKPKPAVIELIELTR